MLRAGRGRRAPRRDRLYLTGDHAALREEPRYLEQRRQGKLQPFKRLFRKRKKKERDGCFLEAGLKASSSTGDVCNGLADHDGTKRHLREPKALGYRAVSHDSVFVPEGLHRAESMSQEDASDRLRSLQKQIAQSIKFGQKGSSLSKSDDADGSSDGEEAPRRSLQVSAQVEAEPTDMKFGPSELCSTTGVQVGAEGVLQGGFQAEPQNGCHSGSMKTPVKSPRSKRVPPAAGTIESINLDAVPLLFSCLDSSAARHKLSVKPKNQRLSHKHRRFTQDMQNLCPTERLQEQSEPQTPADTISNRSRAEREVSLWSEDEHTAFAEKSKKPKLQTETTLMDFDWRCEEQQETRRELEFKGNVQNAEKEMGQEQRKVEELRVHETEDRKGGEEKKVKMRDEEENKRRKDEDVGEEQSGNEEPRRQEMMELQQLKAERLHTEEESRWKRKEKRPHELEEQRVQRETEEEEQKQAQKKRMEEDETRQQQEQDKQLKEAEQQKCPNEVSPVEKAQRCSEEGTQLEEWKRKAEELRWKEMEERQRPFTFKVSSGEKQILFQRVNLSPVTPSSQQGSSNDFKLSKSPPVGITESPTLPSSVFVPHTAILVTGAQLCGAAVNLDQIKDPACKSLLGLTEDKKAMGLPLNKGPGKSSPERKSTKTKSLNESSVDHSSSAVLAEWATIRSKIFKRAENGNIEDKETRHPNQPLNEDLGQKPVSISHSNLRKTVSANAKFSITPARQKFPDSSKASEALNPVEKDGGHTKSSSPDTRSPLPVSPGTKPQSRVSKTVRILDRTEGCVFAKDLPSFLVPSPPHASLRTRSQSEALNPADSDFSSDSKGQSSEDKTSPFGIKLRRTNYSLRFRNEQPMEKRKKRYSAGDSFDGIPVPLTSIDPDSDTSVPSDKSSPSSPLRNMSGAVVGRLSHVAVSCESDRLLLRPMQHKPLVAPKPGSGTPPPSPRSPDDSAASGSAGTSNAQRGKREMEKGQESSGLQPTAQHAEDGPKERKSFFPTISMPWREKGDRRAEVLRREKPFLQSRHSLDSGRVQGKEAESPWTDSERAQEKEAGPLWITLALQKQKGFREQQQSREEHRHMREVRLAEKQSKEHSSDLSNPGSREGDDSHGGGGSSSATASAQKALEGDKVDNPLSLFERREHLRKANTLPSSVTVEIADVATSAPPAKDSVKRFPSTEPVQVSTEPAWLALAKRKAKAWSDCPQIIK